MRLVDVKHKALCLLASAADSDLSVSFRVTSGICHFGGVRIPYQQRFSLNFFFINH